VKGVIGQKALMPMPITSYLFSIQGRNKLFLLMSVFSKAFFSFVSSDLVSFSFFSARHNDIDF